MLHVNLRHEEWRPPKFYHFRNSDVFQNSNVIWKGTGQRQILWQVAIRNCHIHKPQSPFSVCLSHITYLESCFIVRSTYFNAGTIPVEKVFHTAWTIFTHYFSTICSTYFYCIVDFPDYPRNYTHEQTILCGSRNTTDYCYPTCFRCDINVGNTLGCDSWPRIVEKCWKLLKSFLVQKCTKFYGEGFSHTMAKIKYF